MNQRNPEVWRRPRCGLLVGLVLGAACTAGCGGPDHEQVTGRVTFEETGQPLAGARVVVFSPQQRLSADGVTDADGNYTLGTRVRGDGLPVGQYQVLVSPPLPLDLDEVEELIDPTLTSFDTSGLSLQVEQGTNRYDIQVRRPPAPDKGL